MGWIARLVILTLLVNDVVRALTDAEISTFVAKTYLETNTGLQGTVSVTTSTTNTAVLELASNGIPDHATGVFPSNSNPNSVAVQSNAWKIPKSPAQASSTTCLPQGPIGMAINGVPILNPYSSTCCDTGTEEIDLFDVCYGHPAPGNVYHYHLNPSCLFSLICNEPSSIIGVAFDGFPIYGPNDEDGTLLTTTDLDDCNGKVTNGQYRYHITNDFPYIIGCFKGTVRMDSGIPISNTCTCTTPTIPCTEFTNAGRRKRQVTDISFTCCVENVNCTTTTTSTAATTTSTSSACPVDFSVFITLAYLVVALNFKKR